VGPLSVCARERATSLCADVSSGVASSRRRGMLVRSDGAWVRSERGPVRSCLARVRSGLALIIAACLAMGPLASSPAWARGEPGRSVATDDAAADDAASGGGDSEAAAKLEQAGKALEALNYTEAQQILFQVTQSGAATVDQLAQAYFNIGVVESALDNEVEARDAFYLALMIKPELLFPEGGSPKIRQRLNEARSRVTEVGVLDARASLVNHVLEVRLQNDPLGLVKRVDVQMTRSGGEVGKAKLDKKAMRVEVDPEVTAIQVVLHDEAGNQLKVIDVDPSKTDDKAAPVDALSRPSLWGSWGLWAGVAAACALGGTYFIMESGSIQSDIDKEKKQPAPSDAKIQRLGDNRDRVGTYGVVGFSLAGVAAVTAGVLLAFGGKSSDKDKDKGKEKAESATLLPSGGPGQLGAEFRMRF
jgi:hypothetical protein